MVRAPGGFMLHAINKLVPVRYLVFVLCALGSLTGLYTLHSTERFSVWLLLLPLALLGLYDLLQTRRSILRNYPVIGHLRFMLEFIRPELRQYFLESDTEATP